MSLLAAAAQAGGSVDLRAAAAKALLDAQVLYDRFLQALPGWVPYALFAVAVALVALGREGQRVFAALLLGGEAVLFALLVVAPRLPGSPVAGAAAIVGGAAGIALGLSLPEWGSALAVGSACGAEAALLARALFRLHLTSLPWPWLAGPAALLGFFCVLAAYRKVSVVLPPLAAALAASLGLSRSLGPHFAGAAVPELALLPWVAAAFAGLAAALVSLAVLRERFLARRHAARSVWVNDDELKKQIAQRRGKSPVPLAPDAQG